MLAVVGILAALHERSRTGLSQHIDAAMIDGCLSLIAMRLRGTSLTIKSKERLLLKVPETIEARSIDATIARVKLRDGSPSQQLDTFVKYQTQWAATHPEDLAVMILMSVEISRARSKIRTQMFRVYRKLGGFLETIIDAGKSTGEFSTQQNTKDIVLYLEAVHDGNMLLWYRSGNDPEIGRKLTRATLNGFTHAVQGS